MGGVVSSWVSLANHDTCPPVRGCHAPTSDTSFLCCVSWPDMPYRRRHSAEVWRPRYTDPVPHHCPVNAPGGPFRPPRIGAFLVGLVVLLGSAGAPGALSAPIRVVTWNVAETDTGSSVQLVELLNAVYGLDSYEVVTCPPVLPWWRPHSAALRHRHGRFDRRGGPDHHRNPPHGPRPVPCRRHRRLLRLLHPPQVQRVQIRHGQASHRGAKPTRRRRHPRRRRPDHLRQQLQPAWHLRACVGRYRTTRSWPTIGWSRSRP